MSKAKTSVLIAAGFLGGIVFLAGCLGSGGIWQKIGTTIFYNDGNVGIGTSSPSEKLHVLGDSLPKIKIESSTNSNAIIDLKGGGSGSKDFMIFSSGSGSFAGPGKLVFYDYSLASSTNDDQLSIRMVIDSDGDIGIGTTSPASKLAVHGLPTSAPDNSGNAGIVCVTKDGNFWLDNVGAADCN